MSRARLVKKKNECSHPLANRQLRLTLLLCKRALPGKFLEPAPSSRAAYLPPATVFNFTGGRFEGGDVERVQISRWCQQWW